MSSSIHDPLLLAAARMSTATAPRAGETGLRWYQGLQFKIGSLFAILLAVLAAVAFHAADRLIGNGLEQASFRHEAAVNHRLAAELEQIVGTAEQFAQALALSVNDPQSVLPARLGEWVSASLPMAGFGLWPEPASTTAGAPRRSQYWRLNASGKPEARADYNAADAIPYWREPWYTPARFASAGHCIWSAPYRDPLLGREVVTCAVPITSARGFDGVATVSLDLAALSRRFIRDDDAGRSYALLTDRSGHLLAMSTLAHKQLDSSAAGSRNLAELAQHEPRYNELALAIHRRNEAFKGDALRSKRYDARLVSSLKENSRELSRADAEAALSTIWNTADGRPLEPATTLSFAKDAVFNETAYAVLSTLPGSGWQLLSASPSREGQDTTVYLITQALVLTLGTAVLALVIAFVLLRRMVIRPLHQMSRTLAHSEAAADGDDLAVTLDATGASGELGLIAQWHNQRNRALRDLRDGARLAGRQLAGEAAERLRVQDALQRLTERSEQLMGATGEGLVILDEQGRIEALNTVVEQWLNGAQRSLRGQPLAALFTLPDDSAETAAIAESCAAIWQQVTTSRARVDHPDTIELLASASSRQSVRVSVLPILSRPNRPDQIGGGIVVLSSKDSSSVTTRIMSEALDPVTGLGMRRALEHRVAVLQGQARNRGTEGISAQLSLAEIDFPVLRRVRAKLGSIEADALAVRLAERLAAVLTSSEQLFRSGQDRFAVVLAGDAKGHDQGNPSADASASAEALRLQLAERRLKAGPHSARIEAGIGLCTIDPTLDSAAEVLRRAALACEHADSAQPIAIYAETMEIGAAQENDERWVQRIEQGLEQQLFHLTTQSLQVARAHAAEGEVFEALLALEDEEGFWAEGESFLPVAERHLMGARLDRWAIRELFQRLSTDAALSRRIAFASLNLSARVLDDTTLIDFLVEQINTYPDVPVAKLCFSLSDAPLTEQPQQAIRFCEALRALGLRVSIDHSTSREIATIAKIDEWRRLPVDFLKLDSHQFPRLPDDNIDQTLAETAIRLARLIGCRVIVSGIDSEALLLVWRRLGADYLQGQTVAKPSPVPFKAG